MASDLGLALFAYVPQKDARLKWVKRDKFPYSFLLSLCIFYINQCLELEGVIVLRGVGGPPPHARTAM